MIDNNSNKVVVVATPNLKHAQNKAKHANKTPKAELPAQKSGAEQGTAHNHGGTK